MKNITLYLLTTSKTRWRKISFNCVLIRQNIPQSGIFICENVKGRKQNVNCILMFLVHMLNKTLESCSLIFAVFDKRYFWACGHAVLIAFPNAANVFKRLGN